MAIVSDDEKPGIQAIATTAPDLPPEPGRHATFARDHEYKRHGTVSLLAGIELLTGQAHALVKDPVHAIVVVTVSVVVLVVLVVVVTPPTTETVVVVTGFQR